MTTSPHVAPTGNFRAVLGSGDGPRSRQVERPPLTPNAFSGKTPCVTTISSTGYRCSEDVTRDIRSRRLALGLRLTDLAEKARVPTTLLRKWERGLVAPTGPELRRAA